MSEDPEYHDAMIDMLELIWGRDYMAPGGAGNVANLLSDLDVKGRRVLDVGCGLGRILIPLQELGFEAVGLESCAYYRREARIRAGNDTLEIRSQSIFDFEIPPEERFDAALSVFSVLGYSADPVQDILFSQRLAATLKPGGQVFLQARRPANTTGRFQHRSASGLCLEVRAYDAVSKTMHTVWTVSSRGRQRVYRSQVRVYDRSDLVGLLEFCGFEQVRAYEEPQSERISVVGVRSVDNEADAS